MMTAFLPSKENMNIQTTGAQRPKLSLPFGRPNSSRQPSVRRSPLLSDHELRRIVAGMIG
jgi:hypothetical protein